MTGSRINHWCLAAGNFIAENTLELYSWVKSIISIDNKQVWQYSSKDGSVVSKDTSDKYGGLLYLATTAADLLCSLSRESHVSLVITWHWVYLIYGVDYGMDWWSGLMEWTDGSHDRSHVVKRIPTRHVVRHMGTLCTRCGKLHVSN